jgi:ribosomal protein S18 acetylase RimI-like enzyme
MEDVPLLARMNRCLAEDEGHRNRNQAEAWFSERMSRFLVEDYRAVLFEIDGALVGYALYTEAAGGNDNLYLRQLYVERGLRRRGYGREMMRILREEIWPKGRRITLGVLSTNESAIAFYQSIGFHTYAVEMELPEN